MLPPRLSRAWPKRRNGRLGQKRARHELFVGNLGRRTEKELHHLRLSDGTKLEGQMKAESVPV